MNMILKIAMSPRTKKERVKKKKLRGDDKSYVYEAMQHTGNSEGRKAVGDILSAPKEVKKPSVPTAEKPKTVKPKKSEPKPARAPKPGQESTPARAPKPPTKQSGGVGPAMSAAVGRHALAAGGIAAGVLGTGLAYRHYRNKKKAEEAQ